MIRHPSFCIFLLVMLLGAFAARSGAQEIVTAEKFMERVSAKYAGFKDYEGQIQIKTGENDMLGTVSYRSPAFLRIDFSNPAQQVIVFNGEMLTVYLPAYRAILTQQIPGGSGTGGAHLATANGLSLLRRNYAASYVTGPDPVPLDETSTEQVVMIKLTRRYSSEGFREIIVSINPETLFIRRMVGSLLTGDTIEFDFTDVKTNIGIPEMRFTYDSPASANIYNNFLLRETEE